MSAQATATEAVGARLGRIESVRARVLAARAQRGVTFAIGPYDVYTLVLVEVRTDDGLVGYGEAIARRGAAMTRAAVEDLLAPAIVGRAAEDIGGLWVQMIDQLRRWGHTQGVVVEAISGVDCALWDLAGQVARRPVWRLLHGAGRERVPVYASSVYIAADDAMMAEARQQADLGFRGVKVKVGRTEEEGGWRADVGVLEKIRGAVGPGVELMVDANAAFDAATAIRFARAVEPLDLKWLEEPVPADDLDGYRRIRQMTAVPLAAGEAHFAPFGFRALLHEGLIDYVQPDLGRCGGITAAQQLQALVYAHNKRLSPHTGFSGGLSQLAALHVAAAAPNLEAFEHMFIDNRPASCSSGAIRRRTAGSSPRPRRPAWASSSTTSGSTP